MASKESHIYTPVNWEFAKAQLLFAINSRQYEPLIGIDGPVAVGKGWIAKQLSDIFGYKQVSNGNAVRAFTWFYIHYCDESNLLDGSFQNYVDSMKVSDKTINGQKMVKLKFKGKSIDLNPEGKDKLDGLRSSEIEEVITKISSLNAVVGQVRQRNKEAARQAQEDKYPVVFEGRDNYETLREFPHALRIYLTADAEVLFERAIMRENKRRAGLEIPQPALTSDEIELLEQSIRTRNTKDMDQPYGQGKLLTLEEASREPGYKIVDTTEYSKDQSRYAVVVAQLLHLGISPQTENFKPLDDQPTQPKLL